MAYFDGDLDHEQLPIVDRMDTEYAIHVKNLPIELNEDAIGDIFGQYGKIIGMFHPRNATWAFITYGTFGEAELAVRKLNNMKPLNLKVALAKERSNKEEHNSNEASAQVFEEPKPIKTQYSIPTQNDICYSSMGRGQSMNTVRKSMPQMYRYVDESASPFSQPIHEIDDPYAHTNKLWTRGMITVTPDGKRQVSLGRGYTLYEYPEPYPKIEQCISNVYEQRNNGLYEYSKDKLKNGVRSCSVCSTKTTKHCEKCRTYYCSKVCQSQDWPRHQAECERIPALVDDPIDMSPLQINQTKKILIPDAVSKTAKCSDTKLRRPNTINAAQVANSSNMNTNIKDHTDVAYKSTSNDTQTKHGQYDNINVSQNDTQTKQSSGKYDNVSQSDTQTKHSSGQYENINVSQKDTRIKHSSGQHDNINVSQSDTQTKHSPDQYEHINVSQSDTQTKHSSGQYEHINVSQNKMPDQSVVNTNAKEFSQQHRLRKYNNGNTDQLRKNNEYSSTSISTDQRRNHQRDSNKASPKNEKYNNSGVRNRTYNNVRNHVSPKSDFQSDKDSACYNGREDTNRQRAGTSSNTVDNDIDFYKDTHLSKTKFTTVEIMISLDNDEYWVNKVEDKDACMDLMQKLQDVAEKSRNMQPIIGEVYGAMYENFWYRAMVISLKPTKVNFIDFGNDEILEKDEVVKDIGDLVKAPKFARKIRLVQGTDDKYRNLQQGENISVRMLSIDSEKTITVEVQEQSTSLSSNTTENASNSTEKKLTLQDDKVSSDKSTKATTDRVRSILHALVDLLTEKAASEMQIDGFIQICESVQKNVYSATLSPQVYNAEIEMIFNDLPNEFSEIQATTDYKPKADELVCGKCSDGWYRGYITICPETSSNLSIIKIDEARIQSVDKILPCPDKYLNISALGVMCEIGESANELEVGEIYEFTTIVNEKSTQENLKIEIIINSDVIQAVVRPWRSLANSPSPVLSELKNGSKICLTSYRNHYSMFGRSLDEEQVEYYNNVMQSVAQYAQTAPHLSEPPVHQQVVIAPFNDGNSYRAMVLKMIENDKARIVYIDFGNIDDVDLKDLKTMPQCHSLQQSCTAKVILRDVPHDVPSNQEVDLYLRNLVGRGIPLVYSYEGTSSKDGVRLTTLTGECINDKINQLLIPRWKSENNDNTCYMLRDIKHAKLGSVGDTVMAMIMYIRKDNKTSYLMAPYDVELLTHITGVMPAMMTEYCEKTEYYIPRAEELCLALYYDEWYRAACINPKESHTTATILFIDYGNIESVDHKNLRLMPRDFVAPEATANLCTVVNLAPVDKNGNYSEAVQKKIDEMIVSNSPCRIKIVEYIEEEYKVELPEVRDTLIKQGLM